MSLRGITQETELSSAALCHRLAERDRIYADVLHRYADRARPNAKRLRGLADHTIASYSKPQEPKRKRSKR